MDEPLDDPREDLVRQLLEYKKYRDAASMLDERGRVKILDFGLSRPIEHDEQRGGSPLSVPS